MIIESLGLCYHLSCFKVRDVLLSSVELMGSSPWLILRPNVIPPNFFSCSTNMGEYQGPDSFSAEQSKFSVPKPTNQSNRLVSLSRIVDSCCFFFFRELGCPASELWPPLSIFIFELFINLFLSHTIEAFGLSVLISPLVVTLAWLYPVARLFNSPLFLNSHSVSTVSLTLEERKLGLKSEYETNSSTVTRATCDSKVSSRSSSSSVGDMSLFFKLNIAVLLPFSKPPNSYVMWPCSSRLMRKLLVTTIHNL